MIRLVLLAMLSGCASHPPVPTELRQCAESVAVPEPAPRFKTPAAVAALEIRVELAREKERARGDDCADRLARLNIWIARNR